MKMYFRNGGLLMLFSLILVSCTVQPAKKDTPPNFQPFFEEYGVKGCFLVYDMRNDHYQIYNSRRCEEEFLPASTFKILNALIGLETGVITDDKMVIPWDGVVRSEEIWNKDHTLASAMQYSVVPYFQKVARRIGPERMKKYVEDCDYGRMDVTAETIDHFWLSGKSRITPWEQMNFLINFYDNKLPFSAEHLNDVKQLIILEENPKWIFRGKTGMANQDGRLIGWLIGYVEDSTNTWLYVCNVESDESNMERFKASRRGITEKVFRSMGLMVE
ncbi:MAG: class D beta-lactamase [Bacteroidales bacterium]